MLMQINCCGGNVDAVGAMPQPPRMEYRDGKEILVINLGAIVEPRPQPAE